MSVLEAEMNKLAYTFFFRDDKCFRKTFASILESIAAELRMNADSKYKCSLLKDTKI